MASFATAAFGGRYGMCSRALSTPTISLQSRFATTTFPSWCLSASPSPPSLSSSLSMSTVSPSSSSLSLSSSPLVAGRVGRDVAGGASSVPWTGVGGVSWSMFFGSDLSTAADIGSNELEWSQTTSGGAGVVWLQKERYFLQQNLDSASAPQWWSLPPNDGATGQWGQEVIPVATVLDPLAPELNDWGDDFGDCGGWGDYDGLSEGYQCTRKAFRPGTLKGKRKHGFLNRMSTKNGRRVVARRRSKQRRRLTS